MEENFTPHDSLLLIRSMIGKTRNNLSDNRFYFLLWGWVVFLAFLVEFILKVLIDYEHHYIVWLAVIPAVILTIMYSARKKNQQAVRTYVADSMSYIWTGIGISFFVLGLIISNMQEGWNNGYPFFILFYGLGTFVSGKLLKFTPLIVGGILNWVLAIASVFVAFDYQMLLAAAAVLASYIIPGHLLGSSKN